MGRGRRAYAIGKGSIRAMCFDDNDEQEKQEKQEQEVVSINRVELRIRWGRTDDMLSLSMVANRGLGIITRRSGSELYLKRPTSPSPRDLPRSSVSGLHSPSLNLLPMTLVLRTSMCPNTRQLSTSFWSIHILWVPFSPPLQFCTRRLQNWWFSVLP